MQRTKVLAVVGALVVAGASAIMLLGGATAASWHVYQGDVHAGHAYGLQVPPGADAIEFLYEGPESGAASIAVHSPEGDRVGHYALSTALDAASIANPAPGQYALYVYEIDEGAVSVRVSSEDEPALELTSISLAREETTIGEFAKGPLDQAITAELPREAVFVTLLYEGSSRGLDATVASEAGNVVTIVDETATAFSPGVWTTIKGDRSFDAANLAGTKYDVEVHAEDFEGTMVLTTLALQIPKAMPHPGFAPPMPPAPPAPPMAPEVPEHAPFVPSPASFALDVGQPVAFDAPAGTLQLVDPGMLECEAEAEAHDDEDSRDCSQWSHAAIAIYTPDDALLASVTLDHETPVAEVELPVAGEYVAYAHWSDSDVVLAKLLGANVAPTIRYLEVAEESIEVERSDLLASEEAEIVLANVPLAITLALDGIGALADATLENEKGMVATTHGAFVLGGTPFGSGTYQVPENFAKGAHTLFVDGAFEGSARVTSLHYVRASEIAPEDVHAHAHDAHTHGTDTSGDAEAEETASEEESAKEEPSDDEHPLVTLLRELGL